ncbi:phytanoyl-CoA dioxygenase family protein [Rhodoferax sp. AJA081-3]|uniref:phytanoyl-CoA dioxygenase family protein n=1 Tax=Rhodoferax sp. AJA081-3 TaxID=2752316 RepID=UPI001ADF2AFA|nr:phytanoyl-CoA dioxygenase family protein [Rhodoferax sp. AJA081-3]QTN26695.1 phytanoyl-CoA dioxygenase family protein [Rhodoferax sp. AJA081-3]
MSISQQITAHGFAVLAPVLSDAECDTLAEQAARGASASGGTRKLMQHAWCRALAAKLRQHPLLSPLLTPDMVAVQCTYFEKSATRNWLVPLHQDLSIPVAHRVDHPSLGPWSEKEGALFVQPPSTLLQQLIAVRVHIDTCTANDGALRVLAGSHRLGMLDTEAAAAARQTHTEQVCTVARGGVLIMRPLLLHASSKSTGSSQRRVLHFLFGPAALPLGLAWQDAV